MKKLYKRFILILISGLLLSNISMGQTETDTAFFSQMNYIFAHVDKSKVPHGILRDFGMEFTNLENYSGTAPLADSNYADVSAFWDVYQTYLPVVSVLLLRALNWLIRLKAGGTISDSRVQLF